MNLPDSVVCSLFALSYILCSPGQLCWRALFRLVGPVSWGFSGSVLQRGQWWEGKDKSKNDSWRVGALLDTKGAGKEESRQGQSHAKPSELWIPSPTSGCVECRGWDVCFKAVDFCLLLPFTHSAEAVLDKIGSVMSLVEWRWREKSRRELLQSLS